MKILSLVLTLIFLTTCANNDKIVNKKRLNEFQQQTLCVRNKVPEINNLLSSGDILHIGNYNSINKNNLDQVLLFLGNRITNYLASSYNKIDINEFDNFNQLIDKFDDYLYRQSVEGFDLYNCKTSRGYGEGEIYASLNMLFSSILAPNYNNRLDNWFLSYNNNLDLKYDLFRVLVSMNAADKYDDIGKILDLYSDYQFKELKR